MTLSRKAIRLNQTRYLLNRHFLPVSIDYRLCPEVNLIDGPMADVRDAYRWVRTVLPQKLRSQGILVACHNVVVIGWSTGGHLAISLGWTAKEIGLPPPIAVLSFYAPTDFESGGKQFSSMLNTDKLSSFGPLQVQPIIFRINILRPSLFKLIDIF